MSDMPRPRKPYLRHEKTRHGKWVWYFKRPGQGRIRLPDAFGTKAFDAAYDAAFVGDRIAPQRAKTGSLSWLVARYKESEAWSKLSLATQRQRENIMRGVLENAGDEPYGDITRKTIVAGRDRRKATPAMARHFVEMMRGLFRWALDAEHIEADPTRDVKVSKPRTDGHHTWTDEECDRFEAKWPIGTRERLAFDILLYTGLRRGDAAILGRQHVKDGIITLRTGKTGQTVILPLLAPLRVSIDATKTGDLAFVAAASGGPMTKESFGNWFAEACRAAEVPGRAHGLRKAGATRAANGGASESQLEAIFGWRGGGMASLYTRKANRERLALASAKLLLPQRNETVYGRTLSPGAGLAAKNQDKSNA